MPSLLNTTVAANYGQMSKQDTYGTGPAFTNFGTRSLRLLKVTLGSGSLNDMTYADGNATGTYADANSLFGKIVTALQQSAEIYVVGQPTATVFMALVANDTVNDAGATNNISDGTYSAMEAQIKSVIDNRTAAMGAGAAGTATTVTITASGTAAYPNFFVGGAVGTFA
jgi:hypothetical protein